MNRRISCFLPSHVLNNSFIEIQSHAIKEKHLLNTDNWMVVVHSESYATISTISEYFSHSPQKNPTPALANIPHPPAPAVFLQPLPPVLATTRPPSVVYGFHVSGSYRVWLVVTGFLFTGAVFPRFTKMIACQRFIPSVSEMSRHVENFYKTSFQPHSWMAFAKEQDLECSTE